MKTRASPKYPVSHCRQSRAQRAEGYPQVKILEKERKCVGSAEESWNILIDEIKGSHNIFVLVHIERSLLKERLLLHALTS